MALALVRLRAAGFHRKARLERYGANWINLERSLADKYFLQRIDGERKTPAASAAAAAAAADGATDAGSGADRPVAIVSVVETIHEGEPQVTWESEDDDES